jgi:thymidylate synthase ThyX
LAIEAAPVLVEAMPTLFDEFRHLIPPEVPLFVVPQLVPEPAWSHTLLPIDVGQARVTLLGFNYVWPYPAHSSAVFLVDGVSRALSHQFVRHRLASYSQESQRYVDLEKGGWQAIVPPAIRQNPAAFARMQEAYTRLENDYRALRDLGIRKEDARFLLPNAAETRFVVTMPFPAWSHFLWMRAVDKAAQWEIRAVGLAILELLHEVAPLYFDKIWQQRNAAPVPELSPVPVGNGAGAL